MVAFSPGPSGPIVASEPSAIHGTTGSAMSSAADAAPPSFAMSNDTVVCAPTSIPETTSPGFGASCAAGAFSVTVNASLVVGAFRAEHLDVDLAREVDGRRTGQRVG